MKTFLDLIKKTIIYPFKTFQDIKITLLDLGFFVASKLFAFFMLIKTSSYIKKLVTFNKYASFFFH